MKQESYGRETTHTPRHKSWSVCRVDGDWRIIDNQGVTETQHPGHTRNEAATNENEFHFLPDPHKFIFSHFPNEKEHQLLSRPVSRYEFDSMAYLQPAFLEMGYRTITHPRFTIVAIEGDVTIDIGLPPGQEVSFQYSLYDVTKPATVETTHNGIQLNRYALLQEIRHNKSNILRCGFTFPKAALYKFSLFASVSTMQSRLPICTYIIEAKKQAKNSQPLPEFICNTMQWGSRAQLTQSGLTPLTHKTGDSLNFKLTKI